jgi:hypothetical protein
MTVELLPATPSERRRLISAWEPIREFACAAPLPARMASPVSWWLMGLPGSDATVLDLCDVIGSIG